MQVAYTRSRSRGACVYVQQAVYTKVNLDCARLLDAKGAENSDEGGSHVYDDNNKRYLLPLLRFSLSLSFSPPPSPYFSFYRSRAVRALPAVPLICRFVCAFKHDSPGRIE